MGFAASVFAAGLSGLKKELTHPKNPLKQLSKMISNIIMSQPPPNSHPLHRQFYQYKTLYF